MIDTLIRNNMAWARARMRADPQLLMRFSEQQATEYLRKSCSDSRVPANEVVGLDSGEMFFHRNMENLAPSRDINFLSVIQYPLKVLKVRHIIVCRHYGCHGVCAALDSNRRGLIDYWLQLLADLAHRCAERFDAITDFKTKINATCQQNMRAQGEYVGRNRFIIDAWCQWQTLDIHGWIYSVRDGLIRNFDLTAEKTMDVETFARRSWCPDG